MTTQQHYFCKAGDTLVRVLTQLDVQSILEGQLATLTQRMQLLILDIEKAQPSDVVAAAHEAIALAYSGLKDKQDYPFDKSSGGGVQ